MKDINDFISLLKRHKYIILLLPVLTAVTTYFLVRKSPNVYSSKARIETGISDQASNLLNDEAKPQKSEIDQKFTNLVQLMQLRKVVEQVSYQLILHDLTDKKPFRSPSMDMKVLSPAKKQQAINVIKAKHAAMGELSTFDPKEKVFSDLIESMRYDYESLIDRLLVYRSNNSDFIDIRFESENAELSAFVANTLCKEIIVYHKNLTIKNQGTAINYLATLLQIKLDTLNYRVNELKLYKTKNRILNLSEQARALFGQIKDYETFKETSEKEITAYTAAIKDIENKFNPNDRKYVESALVKINGDIVETKNLLRIQNERYLTSNFNPVYKASVDSLRNLLALQINQGTDKYIYSPLVAKQALVSKKLEMEVSLDLAKNGQASLIGELKRLNKKFDELVPHEAVIQAYERGVDVATREYLEILSKYNQTNMAGSYAINLKQIEVAVPGAAAPAKRMLLVIISGIVSLVFCLIVFFVIFYLDNTIKITKHLVFKSNITVLGYLPHIKFPVSELTQTLNQNSSVRNVIDFKDQLRAIRFEIEQEMNGMKQLAVTSIKSREGKTMVAVGLAYAYSLTNKKVLLIDGNFDNSDLSKSFQTEFYLEDLLVNKISPNQLLSENNISILANKGGDISLFEVNNALVIEQKLNELSTIFDVIIIDTPPLSALNKAGEWIRVTDKLVAVFEADKSISPEVQLHINYLKTLDNFTGWILNKVSITEEKVEKKKRKSSKVAA